MCLFGEAVHKGFCILDVCRHLWFTVGVSHNGHRLLPNGLSSLYRNGKLSNIYSTQSWEELRKDEVAVPLGPLSAEHTPRFKKRTDCCHKQAISLTEGYSHAPGYGSRCSNRLDALFPAERDGYSLAYQLAKGDETSVDWTAKRGEESWVPMFEALTKRDRMLARYIKEGRCGFDHVS